MQIRKSIAIAAAIGLGAGAFAAAPAFAQQGQQGQQGYAPQQQQSTAKSSDFSDAQVKKFSQAQQNVQKIAQKWQDKIQNASDKEAAMKYRQKASQSMVKAVKKTGLSVSDYNKISRAAATDQDLVKRIQQAQ